MELHSLPKDQGQEVMTVRWEPGMKWSLYQKRRRFKYLIFAVELVSNQEKRHENQGVGQGGG